MGATAQSAALPPWSIRRPISSGLRFATREWTPNLGLHSHVVKDTSQAMSGILVGLSGKCQLVRKTDPATA